MINETWFQLRSHLVVLVHTAPPQAVFDFLCSRQLMQLEQGPAYFSNLIFNEDELAGTYAYSPSQFSRKLRPLITIDL